MLARRVRSRIDRAFFTAAPTLPMPQSPEAIEEYTHRLGQNRRWVLFAMHAGEGQTRMLEVLADSEAMLLTLRQLLLGELNPLMSDQTRRALHP